VPARESVGRELFNLQREIMNKTSIEWTHRPETGGAAGGFTWNPIRARRLDLVDEGHRARVDHGRTGTFCTRISPGCKNCYASKINMRFGTGAEYTVPNLADHEFYIDEKILAQPMKRKKPATIFVGDMFDLFHEAIPAHLILRVYEVMEVAEQHTFQVLTKRANRIEPVLYGEEGHWYLGGGDYLGNVWLGVSVEDQQRADERIPLLLQTPAAVRFLSVEPMLEVISFRWAKWDNWTPHPRRPERMGPGAIDEYDGLRMLDWMIVGGESGPGARPFRTEWAQSIVNQCKAAGVACFVKQLGSNVIQDGEHRKKRDRKGGDMDEWPHELRVREFPQAKAVTQ
jgi:protein gp37